MSGRPVFRLVPFPKQPVPDGTPLEIFTSGVPVDDGLGYHRNQGLEIDKHVTAGWILYFAKDESGDPIGIELATGRVVWAFRQSLWPTHPHLAEIAPGFINSTLAAFNESRRAIVERFPYYNRGAKDEEIDAVARELADTLRSIDPAAMIPDRFWSTFIDDLQMGDYATEDVFIDERSG